MKLEQLRPRELWQRMMEFLGLTAVQQSAEVEPVSEHELVIQTPFAHHRDAQADNHLQITEIIQ